MIYVLIILFGVSILYLSMTSRIEAYIKILAFQGFLLFMMVLLGLETNHWLNFIFLSLETLGFKTIFMPLFLTKLVRKNEIYRETGPYRSHFFSLALATLIFAFGFFVAYWSVTVSKDIKPLFFGVSISTMITGLIIIISRKKVITHVIGYMTLENGIFLLSLSAAKEMPLIVNLGVLLDVFLAVFLFGMFINRIETIYEDGHIDRLSDLKD